MPIPSLDSQEAIDAALASRRLVLLKHSRRCPVSAWAWEQVESMHRAHPDLEVAWIDVVSQRMLSREVADRTGVRHESPQVFVILDGDVVHHASHMDVQRTSIEDALGLPA